MLALAFLICMLALLTTLNTPQISFTQVSASKAWPQFRGPNASGVANPAQNPPIEFGQQHNLLWKTALISGVSSPCIWDDRIFLTGFDEEQQQLQVLCYNRLDGTLIWRQIVSAEDVETVHEISNPANATPATDGERVYVYFGSYGLLCYDFFGNKVWEIPMPVVQNAYGTGTSPIVVNDVVILQRDQQKDSHLLAVNRLDGSTIWKTPMLYFKNTHSTPIIFREEVILHANSAFGVRLNDGMLQWYARTGGGASTPVAGTNGIYIAGWRIGGEPELQATLPKFEMLREKYDVDGDSLLSKEEFPDDVFLNRRPHAGNIPGAQIPVKKFFQFPDANRDNKVSHQEWLDYEVGLKNYYQENGLVAIDPSIPGKIDTTIDAEMKTAQWIENRGVPEVPTPLFYDGRVYMVTSGGIVTCLDGSNGKLFYRKRLGAGGPYFSSPVATNQRIYSASRNGIVSVFAAGDEFKVLARNNLAEQIMATPAIVDDKLYIRTDKHLYAFGR